MPIHLFAAAILALTACGDNLHPAAAPDAAVDDAPVDVSSTAVGPCLDRPNHVANTPSGQLPCELISPGFQP